MPELSLLKEDDGQRIEHIWIRVSYYISELLCNTYYYRSIKKGGSVYIYIYKYGSFTLKMHMKVRISDEGCWMHIEVWVIADILKFWAKYVCWQMYKGLKLPDPVWKLMKRGQQWVWGFKPFSRSILPVETGAIFRGLKLPSRKGW